MYWCNWSGSCFVKWRGEKNNTAMLAANYNMLWQYLCQLLKVLNYMICWAAQEEGKCPFYRQGNEGVEVLKHWLPKQPSQSPFFLLIHQNCDEKPEHFGPHLDFSHNFHACFRSAYNYMVPSRALHQKFRVSRKTMMKQSTEKEPKSWRFWMKFIWIFWNCMR